MTIMHRNRIINGMQSGFINHLFINILIDPSKNCAFGKPRWLKKGQILNILGSPPSASSRLGDAMNIQSHNVEYDFMIKYS